LVSISPAVSFLETWFEQIKLNLSHANCT